MGGMFALEGISNANSTTPRFLNEKHILLANARSGIALVMGLLSPSCIWMPSYLCGSMLKAVNAPMSSLKFYEVTYDLVPSSLDWLNNIQPKDLVVLVDYFGFPCNPYWIKRAKEQGAWVLEDACQALLSEEVGRFSDFVLFSPRKFLGIPDGGILTFHHQLAFDPELESPPAAWWLKAFSAIVLRGEFDLQGGSRRWFELFQESELGAPIGPYAMSELSRMLLQHSFDYRKIAQKRIENYQLLLDRLIEVALFPSLPPGVVPLGFPIRVKNRDQVRRALFDHEIYPPVHWPIKGIIPEKFRGSHQLSAEIMTLPCDQRYNRRDMEQMAGLVAELLQ